MTTPEELRLAAERATGGAVKHLETVPVVETVEGAVVWEGMVDVFDAIDHCENHGDRVYAWPVGDGDARQFVTMMGTPPINSPLDAVRAWLVSSARK